MSEYNNLRIVFYKSGTIPLPDIGNEFDAAQDLGFETFYPNGLYGSASAFIPRNPKVPWLVKGNQRMVVYNHNTLVWEGAIDDIERVNQADQEGGRVNSTGYWGKWMMRRNLRRNYVDMRTEEGIWQQKDAPATHGGVCDVGREDDNGACLLFTPTNSAWTDEQQFQLIYDAPAGEHIKQVSFTYDLTTSNALKFTLRLYDIDNAVELWSVSRDTNGTTTSTEDHTLATPSDCIAFQLEADDAQTPPGNGNTYAEIYNLKVYALTNNASLVANDMTEICQDIQSTFPTLINQATGKIQTPASIFTLEPFTADDMPTLADLMNNAVAYGDGAQNVWACGLLSSEETSSPDGLPVLFLEQWPDTSTGGDYVIRIGDENVINCPLREDFSQLANYISVEYDDGYGGNDYQTPLEDAGLKDTTSIANHDQYDYVLRAGLASAGTAINLAKKMLATSKDPQYNLTGSITVKGYVYDRYNRIVPASEIRAGKKIQILDYVYDTAGEGWTMVITRTQYKDADETCEIECGVPDILALLTAQEEYMGPIFRTHKA